MLNHSSIIESIACYTVREWWMDGLHGADFSTRSYFVRTAHERALPSACFLQHITPLRCTNAILMFRVNRTKCTGGQLRYFICPFIASGFDTYCLSGLKRNFAAGTTPSHSFCYKTRKLQLLKRLFL